MPPVRRIVNGARTLAGARNFLQAAVLIASVGLPATACGRLLLGSGGYFWGLLALAPALAVAHLVVLYVRSYGVSEFTLRRWGAFHDADRAGAPLSGDPEALVSALRKMESLDLVWERVHGSSLPGLSLLKTHPPCGKRIKRLKELGPCAWPPVLSPEPGSTKLIPLAATPLRG